MDLLHKQLEITWANYQIHYLIYCGHCLHHKNETMVKVINNNCYFDNLDFVNAKLLFVCFIARTAIGEDGTTRKKKVLSLSYVENNSKQELCFLQQQASKQETSTQDQGKLQVTAACIGAAGCSPACTTGSGKDASECRPQCITVSVEDQRCNHEQ